MMRSKIIVCTLLLCCRFSFSSGQLKVTFEINKISAVKDQDIHLFVAGDFNNWNPGDALAELEKQHAGSWQLQKKLSQGIYNFKITRGSWQKVECSAAGRSTENRSFKLMHDTTI